MGKVRMLLPAGAATLALALVIADPLAAHHGPAPPGVRVSIGAETKRVGAWSSTWTTGPEDGFCMATSADGVPVLGRHPIRVHEGRRVARIIFRTDERPRSVDVTEQRQIDSNGFPIGPSKPLKPRVRRVGGPGPGRWMARVRVNVSRDKYIEVFARWAFEECGGGVDDAAWAFHVAPRDPE